MSDCDALDAKLNTILVGLDEIKNRLTTLENEPDIDLSLYLLKSQLVSEITAKRNEVVASIQDATTWREIDNTESIRQALNL